MYFCGMGWVPMTTGNPKADSIYSMNRRRFGEGGYAVACCLGINDTLKVAMIKWLVPSAVPTVSAKG
jgi:hypothetical protein